MVVWRGVSALDGTTPIVVLATYGTRDGKSSQNTKTGSMVQVFILRDDIDPIAALREGKDAAICGMCPHRSPASGGSGACYVNVGQAPLSVWRAYKRDGIRANRKADSVPFDVEAFRGRVVRFGAYGDPAAAPFHVWEAIAEVASGVTGYTHQWRAIGPQWSRFFMASADSAEEGRQARKLGYRSFIVRKADEVKPRGAVVCPASAEAGRRTVCADCLQCGGTSNGRRADISIVAHGSTARRFGSLPLEVV
jgi:hypothetical protein